ncbi:MAG: lytic transglycosylase domain-containing protein, partial [Gemmatimonadaceae bacterium]|nr:lytic transglycosylase domain-containing protein [Acetobacteraceae bacterium]
MLSHSARNTRIAARVLGCLTLLGAISACSSKPQISAKQESTQYLARASRNYTPPGPASDPWGPYIIEAAAKFDVPDRWIREVMRQESGGRLYSRNGDLITSSAGAMGLMQVMPGTYDELKGRYPELGSDPFDPRNNILAGTAYLREMYDIYGSPGFLAAYNAGPGRLDDYLTRSRTLPEETRRYVASIG